MITVYYLDLKPQEDSVRRRWEELLPGAKKLRWVPGTRSQPLGRLADGPKPGDVLVFHEEELAEVVALSRQGVRVIAVNQGEDSRGLGPDGIYYRKRGVAKPTVGYDTQFAACFANFLIRLDEGLLDWALLEGPPAPDAMLAYHLLGLLRDRDQADSERAARRRQATEEAGMIMSAHSGGGKIAPLNMDDAEAVARFLESHA